MAVLALGTFGRQAGSQVVGEQVLEGGCEVSADDLVVDDVEGTEYGLVQIASAARVAGEVVLLGVSQ